MVVPPVVLVLLDDRPCTVVALHELLELEDSGGFTEDDEGVVRFELRARLRIEDHFAGRILYADDDDPGLLPEAGGDETLAYEAGCWRNDDFLHLQVDVLAAGRDLD